MADNLFDIIRKGIQKLGNDVGAPDGLGLGRGSTGKGSAAVGNAANAVQDRSPHPTTYTGPAVAPTINSFPGLALQTAPQQPAFGVTAPNVVDPGNVPNSPYDDIIKNLYSTLNQGYQQSDVSVPQIDIGDILSKMFDPQYAAIDSARNTAKGDEKTSAGNLDKLTQSVISSIKNEGAQSIQDAFNKSNTAAADAGKTAIQNLTDAANSQSQARMSQAQALGLSDALAQPDVAAQTLNEGAKDAANSQQATQNTLNEYNSIDKNSNEQSAEIAGLQGQERRATLAQQLQGILGQLDNQQASLGATKAQTQAQLETQNQQAAAQATQLQQQDQAAFLANRNSAQQQLASVTGQKNADALAQAQLLAQQQQDAATNAIAQQKAAPQTLDPVAMVLASNPSFNPGSVEGVMRNLQSAFNDSATRDDGSSTTPNWNTALSLFSKKYPKANVSNAIARALALSESQISK